MLKNTTKVDNVTIAIYVETVTLNLYQRLMLTFARKIIVYFELKENNSNIGLPLSHYIC